LVACSWLRGHERGESPELDKDVFLLSLLVFELWTGTPHSLVDFSYGYILEAQSGRERIKCYHLFTSLDVLDKY
jgi:hypothetical protein